MSEQVKTFLDDIIKNKKEQMMAVILDIKYWGAIKGDHDVDKLRQELSDEQGKLVKSKNGKVDTDGRNIDRINEITFTIENVEKAEAKIKELDAMQAGIETYMQFVSEPDEETLKSLEEVIA